MIGQNKAGAKLSALVTRGDGADATTCARATLLITKLASKEKGSETQFIN